MATPESVKIDSILEITDSESVWHILRVPKAKVAHFGFKGNLRRVVCTLNGIETFNCSLFPSKGYYFLTLSKQLRKKLGVELGDSISIELTKDESKYGMPMPEEFAEVLRQDPDGDRLFNELSPGDQREFFRLWWQERLRAARRVFNDPDQVEQIVALLEAAEDGRKR